MDLFAILATCAALSGAAPQPETPISPADCEAAAADYQANLQSVELSNEDRVRLSDDRSNRVPHRLSSGVSLRHRDRLRAVCGL